MFTPTKVIQCGNWSMLASSIPQAVMSITCDKEKLLGLRRGALHTTIIICRISFLQWREQRYLSLLYAWLTFSALLVLCFFLVILFHDFTRLSKVRPLVMICWHVFDSWFVDMDYTTGESLDALHSADMNSDSGDFECNICFELAQDPIVTLCGHLYCWPCLYEWLQVHSHSHECPICKALIEEHKLVPIYGRGKASSDPRSRLRPGINIPKRPVGQRPQTAPAVDMDYLRHDEFDSIGGLMSMPMPSARFENSTLSALIGAIPALFSLNNVHGFHDATVYGATSGVPYLFSGSFHGGYAHGFHHSNHLDWTKFFMKVLFLIVGFLLIVSLIS